MQQRHIISSCIRSTVESDLLKPDDLKQLLAVGAQLDIKEQLYRSFDAHLRWVVTGDINTECYERTILLIFTGIYLKCDTLQMITFLAKVGWLPKFH